MKITKHHLTIERRPGIWPAPVMQRWTCSCGENSGTRWLTQGAATASATDHVTANVAAIMQHSASR